MALRLMRFLLAVVLTAGVVVVPGRAAMAVEKKEDAKKHYERATSAFGLGKFAEAAVEYEAAFRLRPDPALLYNCAQSYRLAGNKQRAVELYRNYLRLYGEAPNSDDARKHVNDLELEMAATRAVAAHAPPPVVMASPAVPSTVVKPLPPPPPVAIKPTPTPVPTAPPPARPAVAFVAPPAPLPSSPPSASPPPLMASTPAPATSDPQVNLVASPNVDSGGPAPDRESRSLLTRPWFWGIVGAAVVVGTVAIIVGASGPQDPKASLGVVSAN